MNKSLLDPETYRITVRYQQDPAPPVDSGGSIEPVKPVEPVEKAPEVTVLTLNTAKVTQASVAKAVQNAGAQAASITTVVLGKKVRKVGKAAFRSLPNAQTLVVKTKKLKKPSVKKCLKGSRVKTVRVQVGKAKANKAYAKKYKKFFTKKNAGKKAKVKA